LAKKQLSSSSEGCWGVKLDKSIEDLKIEIMRLESFINTPTKNPSDAAEQGSTQWQRSGNELAATSNLQPPPISSGAL